MLPIQDPVVQREDNFIPGINHVSICQRGEYHSTRALIGSSDAGYPVPSTSGRSSVTARAHLSHF